MSVTPTASASDRAYDMLRHRLRDIASQIPPHLFDSIRSSIR
jgi:hypothetical protein